MIFPIINISYLSITINNYNKYNNFIFSKLNHGISGYYKKYIWFIKYDIIIITSLVLTIIPGVITLVSMFGIFLGLIGKKVIDTMSEKLKKREERKQRIKKYKDEIKELENNPDIPISKINEKRLQFFKEKFYDALTCPISLEIFHDPVIVSSGRTYEREYITKIINDKCVDPLTRQSLKKNIIIKNYLINNIKKEFNFGINFNENVFNKIIELLKCPLSHKIFHEPYIAPIGNSGMTYERSYIEEYIYNKKNDPTFNVPIKGELIKNYVIKDMVDSLIEMNQKKKDYSIVLINDINEKNYNKGLISDEKLNNHIGMTNSSNRNNIETIDKTKI